MKLPVKIDTGKKTIKGHILGRWEDASLIQTLRIEHLFANSDIPMSASDRISICSALSSFTEAQISKCRNYKLKGVFDVSINNFLLPNGFEKLPKPETLTLKGKEYKIPKNLWTKEIGQLFAFDALNAKFMADETLEEWQKRSKQIALTVCVFMYQEITGSKEFDEEKALEMLEDIENLPAVIAVPIGVFFWKDYLKYTRPERLGSIEKLKQKNMKQGWKKWLSMVTLRLLMHFRAVTLPSMKKFRKWVSDQLSQN